METRDFSAPPELDRARQRALLVGVGGLTLGALAGLAVLGVERSLFSYLIGFVFWTWVALGCLALAMLHQLSGGGWGVVIRRPLEAAARTLPLMLVLFVPIALGLDHVYEWARPELVEVDRVLQHKHAYLNVPFFLARAALYFAIWWGLAYFLTRWSAEQDRSGDPGIYHKLRTLSGPGLPLYALTVTFASVDWVMSLDPHWFSMIFGILTIGGQVLGALALVVAVLVPLARREPLAGVVRPVHLHDLGKLMLAFVMLWAYFAFSQFLIIWSGNLAEEIPWYLRRLQGNWKWVGLALALLHFALPFALLLSRDLKRRARRLVAVAVLVIVMRAVDTIWMIAPEFHGGGETPAALGILTDLLALIGIGGIWVWWFLGRLKERPLLPLHDPNVEARAAAAVAES
jgi:hypothetical protein